MNASTNVKTQLYEKLLKRVEARLLAKGYKIHDMNFVITSPRPDGQKDWSNQLTEDNIQDLEDRTVSALMLLNSWNPSRK